MPKSLMTRKNIFLDASSGTQKEQAVQSSTFVKISLMDSKDLLHYFFYMRSCVICRKMTS